MSYNKISDTIVKAVIDKTLQGIHDGEERRLTLTIPKTAKLLGINETMMYELARSENFPSLKCGKRLVVPILQLLDWIEKESWGQNN